jgi:hypothetical protein
MPPGNSTTAWRQSLRAHQGRHERLARQDRDAVVALHAVHQHVAVAERLERLAREQLVRRLGLLQAQHIGLRLLEQTPDEADAQPHRVDVPGDQSHGQDLLTITRYESRVRCFSPG